MKIIKTLLILIIISLTGFFVYKYYAPFGAIVKYTYTLKDNPDVVSQLKPISQTDFLIKEGNNYLQIPEFVMNNDKVTFSLKSPVQSVKKVSLKIRFKNTNPEFKIGLRGAPQKDYQYKVLDNKVLDNLNWEKIEEGGISFWQKYKNYESIEELFFRPSRDQITAQYLYNINENYKINKYKKSDQELVFNYPLRSSHVLYTYIKGEPLDLTIEKQDQNAYEGKDELAIRVLKGEKEVFVQEVEDDGITDASRNKKTPQVTHIQIPDLEEGVYRIELVFKGVGDDIYITKITTKQHLLVLDNKIFVVGEKPTTVWTNSKDIDMAVVHKENEQNIKINDSEDIFLEAYKYTNFKMNKNINKIDFTKNDVVVQANDNGYLSFEPDSLFFPKPYNTVEFNNNLDLTTVDYIIADYIPPKNIDNWQEKEVTFDVSDMEITDDTLNFVLEAAGLQAAKKEIIIDLIEVTLIK